jgi:Protein of unknown function (DUF2975)
MAQTRPDFLLTAARLLLYLMGGLFIFALVMLLIGIGAVLTVERASLVAEISDVGAPASFYWLVIFAIALIIVIFIALLRFVQLLLGLIATVDAGDPFTPENARRLEQLGWLTAAIQSILLILFAISWAVERYKPDAGINADFSLSGWFLVLVLFILARVFRHGTDLRAEVEGTV